MGGAGIWRHHERCDPGGGAERPPPCAETRFGAAGLGVISYTCTHENPIRLLTTKVPRTFIAIWRRRDPQTSAFLLNAYTQGKMLCFHPARSLSTQLPNTLAGIHQLPVLLQRVSGGSEQGRVLHGVTRDLWQAAFDAHVPPPDGSPDQVQYSITGCIDLS